ncbi:MAG: penicillin acylase family protein, partial [Gammaproteobacteria bacterium]|nr:penicillin acylase family protein [Gammaproteobacteria bacterium]
MKKRILLSGMLVAIVVAGLVTYASVNRYQRTGEIQLAGLGEPVRVVRDEKGMPFIYAQNHLDATMAQGFISAQDRLFQMELVRRAVTGRLAEVFGAGMREADIRNRTIGIHRAASRHVDLLAPKEKLYLQRYVDGVNAYIDTREDEHPLKVRLTGMQLEPWTPADSLATFYFIGWSGSANLRSEVLAQSMVDKLGIDKAAEIFPVNINPDDTGEGASRALASHLYLNHDNLSGKLLADRHLLAYLHDNGPALGSNNWAVSASHSANGRPIVAGDPHLDARTLPGPIYPMGIITPQYRVVGASMAGMPALVIGRSEFVATAVTNGYGDTQDLYIETPDPENSDNYLEGDVSIPFEVIEETLNIRDKNASEGFRHETIRIRLTKRGPVISDVLPGQDGDRVLSLRWAMAEGMRSTLTLDGLMFAKSV